MWIYWILCVQFISIPSAAVAYPTNGTKYYPTEHVNAIEGQYLEISYNFSVENFADITNICEDYDVFCDVPDKDNLHSTVMQDISCTPGGSFKNITVILSVASKKYDEGEYIFKVTHRPTNKIEVVKTYELQFAVKNTDPNSSNSLLSILWKTTIIIIPYVIAILIAFICIMFICACKKGCSSLISKLCFQNTHEVPGQSKERSDGNEIRPETEALVPENAKQEDELRKSDTKHKEQSQESSDSNEICLETGALVSKNAKQEDELRKSDTKPKEQSQKSHDSNEICSESQIFVTDNTEHQDEVGELDEIRFIKSKGTITFIMSKTIRSRCYTR